MAAAAGQPYAETLTGFKWIGRVEGLAFGYEEALGYCVDPEHVKDKDGVSALLLLCELAAEREGRGPHACSTCSTTSPVEHGLHATDQLSVRVDDLAAIAGGDGPAARRTRRPRSAGSPVEPVDDLALGSADLPPTDGLRYRLADGARVVVRPSGTEPKLKCYLEVVVPVRPGGRRRRRPDLRRRPARRPRATTSRPPPASESEPGQTTSATTNASAETRQGDDLGPGPAAYDLASRARTPPPTAPRCPARPVLVGQVHDPALHEVGVVDPWRP